MRPAVLFCGVFGLLPFFLPSPSQGSDCYRYTAFGKRFDLTGGPPARKDPSFQNRNYDSGLGLYDYRNRSFDPTTGRFIQTDPVDGDDLMNPYTFPGNNPVTNADPMGTDWRWNATAQEWVEVRGPGLYHSPRPLRKGEFPGEYIRSKHWAEYKELPYSEALIAKYEARAGWWGRNIWENEWAEEVRWMGIQNAQWRLRKEGQAPISPEAFALAAQEGVAEAAADVAEPVLAVGDLATNTAAVVFRWPEIATENSRTWGYGGLLDVVQATDVSVKRQGGGFVERWYVSGFYGGSRVIGSGNWYDAATGEADVFEGAELAGSRELAWNERGEQLVVGGMKGYAVGRIGIGLKNRLFPGRERIMPRARSKVRSKRIRPGRRGGPRHRARVAQLREDIYARGLQPEVEVRIRTVAGQKESRYIDVVARDPSTGRIVEAHQVGRTLKSNPRIPVARERAAFRDVRYSPELRSAKRVYHGY